MYISFQTDDKSQSCSNPNQLPCVPGFPICYDIVDVCIYRLNQHGLLSPCRTGSHIESCVHFQCHAHYKCSGYYCISWANVCDGKWDCLTGVEETKCTVLMNCNAKMKCFNSKICLPFANMCDNYVDCPHEDDEMLCELSAPICHNKCFCLNFAIMCQHISLSSLNIKTKFFVSFYLVNCGLLTASGIVSDVAIFANFSLNTLSDVPDTTRMVQLISIDMSHNDIKHIRTHSFSNLVKLSHILLARNNISYVDEKAFVNLGKIHLLDLEGNNLTHLQPTAWHRVLHIHMLKLRHNNFVSPPVLSEFVFILMLDRHQFCCNRPHSQRCVAPTKWNSSCSELLPSTALQVLFPLVFTVVLFCNSMTVVCSVCQQRKRTGLSPHARRKNPCDLIVKLICICNVLSVIHLVIISAGHGSYSITYPLFAGYWQKSSFCVSAFLLCVFSSIFIPLLLAFLSLARLQVVLQPFDSPFKSYTFVAKCLFAFGSVSVCITAVFCTVYFTLTQNSSGLCIPHVDITQENILVLLFLSFTSTEEMCAIVIIVINSYLLIKNLRTSQKETTSTKQTGKAIPVQLATLSLSHILCWLPSNTTFLVLLNTTHYPLVVLHYMTVLCMPVNAIIVPLVFVIVLQRN